MGAFEKVIKKFLDVLSWFFKAFKYSVNDIVLVPGKNLFHSMQICWGILAIEVILFILRLPTFISLPASLTASLLLTLIWYLSEGRLLNNKGVLLNEVPRASSSASSDIEDSEDGD